MKIKRRTVKAFTAALLLVAVALVIEILKQGGTL